MSRRLPFALSWSVFRPRVRVAGLAWAALLLVPAAAVLVIDQAFSLLLAERLSSGEAWPTGSLGPFGVERLDHAGSPLPYVAVFLVTLMVVVLIRPYLSRVVRIPITLGAAMFLGSLASFATSLARSGVIHDFLTIRIADVGPLGWLARTIGTGSGATIHHLVPADLAFWGLLPLVGAAVALGVCEEMICLAKRALPLPGSRGALMITIAVAVGIGGLTIGAATSPDPHQGLDLTATSFEADEFRQVTCTAEAAQDDPVICVIPFGGVH
jgi:hypothetical protein